MSAEPPGPRDTAAAGALLLATIVFCALAGLGIGTAAGAPAPGAVLGGAAGLAAGFWLVYSRFRDI